jgi:hypothetical protein
MPVTLVPFWKSMQYHDNAVTLPEVRSSVTVVIGRYTHDPVVRLLVPNDLATIVTEIVPELLAAFGHQTAYSTDPPLRSAKGSPRLIFFALGVVGAHDAEV